MSVCQSLCLCISVGACCLMSALSLNVENGMKYFFILILPIFVVVVVDGIIIFIITIIIIIVVVDTWLFF